MVLVDISIVSSVKLLETCCWVDVDIVFLLLLSVMLHGGGVLGIGSKYAVVADKPLGAWHYPNCSQRQKRNQN